MAGLTVAILALPLSMAIAVASGVSPDRGLYTAIIGGFLVSALGGSRYQIGGPAGAFIVLVAATVARLGIEGLILTVDPSYQYVLANGGGNEVVSAPTINEVVMNGIVQISASGIDASLLRASFEFASQGGTLVVQSVSNR